MHQVSKRWCVKPALSPDEDSQLSEFPPVLRRILFHRSYSTYDSARQFLRADPPSGVDPFQILGMAEAVTRLEWAISHREPVAIYGDYDVDGVTSTALLVQALRALDQPVLGYIPNRFEEGYGLNNEALDALKKSGYKLVITVDCGVRSLDEAKHASASGLDLIISDHHQPGGELPDVIAVINPKQQGDSYPEKELAGVGLAYKLATALYNQLASHGNLPDHAPSPTSFLDLVALGTVADLAPLLGENRHLVRAGLKMIRRSPRQGLQSLLGVAGLKPNQVTSRDIGFVLGPRLNAAGRLDSALTALELLSTGDVQKTGYLAQMLDSQNRERQKITREVQEQAEQIALDKDHEAYLLFAAHPDFNPGVVGLAASRLTDRYYRPAIVAYQGESFTRGSCRSIPEFHITEALDLCSDLLVRHGGHAAAAGFTVENQNLPALVERLNEIAEDQLSMHDLRPTLHADLELSLSELEPDFIDYLKWLQPTGHKNPEAVFVSRDLEVRSSRLVGREGAHLKLSVSDGWITYDGIAFRQGHWAEAMPNRIDIMYTFELNEYNGRSSLQLNIRDLKPAGNPD